MAINDHVPTVERSPWGILCLILDIVPIPGIGTIIAGAKTSDVKNIIFGILQAVIPVIGWIWGIVWGILIFLKSTPSATVAATA